MPGILDTEHNCPGCLAGVASSFGIRDFEIGLLRFSRTRLLRQICDRRQINTTVHSGVVLLPRNLFSGGDSFFLASVRYSSTIFPASSLSSSRNSTSSNRSPTSGKVKLAEKRQFSISAGDF